MDSSNSDSSANTSTPLWVKVFGIIAIVVFVAFVVLHVAGGGPGRHMAP